PTINTDHECFTLEEALDKLQHGMHILIREGSAAKNFNELHSLIASHTGKVMFCMDDAHPDDLIKGHINLIVARAIALGYNLFDVLQCACINPHLHYKTKSGVLQTGHPADFIIVDDLINFKVHATFINGTKVVSNCVCNLPDRKHLHINRFNIPAIDLQSLQLKTEATQQVNVRVIEALEGQLITNETEAYLMPQNGLLQSDVKQDVLKMVVVNRYQTASVAHAFIKNFNLTVGAIASTVAHDSHNIICVGVTDDAIQQAINAVINHKGALSVYDGKHVSSLPLPIGGLMSDANATDTAYIYSKLNSIIKTMGCTLHAPFMTLSFMALLVIPDLKLSDKGLFSGKSFTYTPLIIND
ncbi:MAG TPA: adenine deaminase C-terminal domain-containing protein, partial [Bacteroidia bacterium]|nr:adenine deaminase C-terminal domain-containing protein [Bacteroidia bacterium]